MATVAVGLPALPGLQPDSRIEQWFRPAVYASEATRKPRRCAHTDLQTEEPTMNSYASLCDDFGVSTYLHGKLEMPTGRETVLHFFEAVQKAFPKMTDFEKRTDDEYMLEEDRDAAATAGPRSTSAGCAAGSSTRRRSRTRTPTTNGSSNWPRTTSTCPRCRPSRWTCCTTSTSSTRGTTTRWWPRRSRAERRSRGWRRCPAARVLHYQPTLMMALDDACQLQCRLSVETRTSAYQVRTGNFPESPISRLLHGPAVLGQAAVQDVRGVVPQPAPRARRTGEQLRHPERHHAAGEDHQHEAVMRDLQQFRAAGDLLAARFVFRSLFVV